MTSWNIIAQSGLMEVFLQNGSILPGFGMYGEQGGESIHNEFNQLKITYCPMPPASRRLESMLQEHYRRIHPESKAVKFKNKFYRKKKTTL